MPPTSEQLPLLGIFYATAICIVSFSTAMSVMTLNINNKSRQGKEVPKIMKIIFFDYIAWIFRINLELSTERSRRNCFLKKFKPTQSSNNENGISLNKENKDKSSPLMTIDNEIQKINLNSNFFLF